MHENDRDIFVVLVQTHLYTRALADCDRCGRWTRAGHADSTPSHSCHHCRTCPGLRKQIQVYVLT